VTRREFVHAVSFGIFVDGRMWLPARSIATPQTSRAAGVPLVLFVCPSGATRSVLACAHFQRLAEARRLAARSDAAGITPDAGIPSAVTGYLKRSGYTIPVSKPRQVTLRDFELADTVVAIACDLKGVRPRGRLERWDDVPEIGISLENTTAVLHRRVDELVGGLGDKWGGATVQ
jgi:hypothetical protein